jgi:hypothetical protein
VHRECEIPLDEQRRQRGRHPLLLGVELGHAEDHVAGALDAALEQAADLPDALAVTTRDAIGQAIEVARGAVDPHAELLDGLAARDLALVVAAHTVGDDVEAPCVIPEERVLVDLTTASDVRASNG